jgi:hypothetical protein
MVPRRRARPRVIELVGPAGAGKSTLAQQLCSRNALLRGPLTMWGLPKKALLESALRITPFLATASVHGRAPQLEALTHMIRLDALRQVVDRLAAHSVVLLDEGPVFGLGWLEVFFPANGDRVTRGWRDRMLLEWADRIDLIVVVDAPDPILAQRIKSREKFHDVKHRTPPEIYAFTERYRRALSAIVETLGAVGVSICRVSTHEPDADAPLNAVAARLETSTDGQ